MTARSGGHYRRHRRAFTQTVRLGRLSRAWFVATGRRCGGLLLLQAKTDGLFPRSSTSQERDREREEEDSLSHQLFLLFDPAQSMH